MTWLVITVIFFVIMGICIVGLIGSEKGAPNRWAWGAGLAGTLVVWLAVTGGMSFARVATGQVGLIYNFAGKLTGTHESAGVFLKAPWSSVKKESVQIQTEEFKLDPSNAAVSKDQQPIYADLQINYQVDPKHVLDLYRNVGPNWRTKLVDSRVLQDFKEITATYPTTAITSHREQLRTDTRQRLVAEFKNFSDAPDAVQVTDFFIRNIGFAKSYTDAIEAKQVQVQAAAQAEAKVAQATAEAQQQVQTAEGQARAIELKGKALRNNPEVLRLEAIDKLNPNAQLIICTGNTCPSILPTGFTTGTGTGSGG